MSSSVKFNRQLKVSFEDGKSIEDLRMIFRVERIAGDAFSKLKIDIYNMVQDNEFGEAVIKEGDKIVIEAGYENNISTLFIGTIRNVQTVKSDLDIITSIFASDLNVESENIVNVSYRKQTDIVSLISDIAFEADIDIADLSNLILPAPVSIKQVLSLSIKSIILP